MATADQHELHSAFVEEVTDWDEANPDHLSHPLTLRWFRDAMLKPLTYEQKVRVMRDLDFGVTRQMKVRQMVRFMDAVQQECLEAGIHLTEPDPDLSKYQSRYRAKEAA